MVSKASEDLPDPERPVKTTSLSRGMERVTFLRLCSRAPRMVIWSVGIRTFGYPLFSRDRKRSARGGDQPPLERFDPALADRCPAPGMDLTIADPGPPAPACRSRRPGRPGGRARRRRRPR